MIELDELLRNLLLGSLVFALIGISWQLMRLISKTTETLEEFRQTNFKVNKLVDKMSIDYEYVSSTIKGLSVTIDNLNNEVLEPIRSIGSIFRTFEGFFKGIWSQFKNSNEPEDYLPVEE